MTLVAALVPVLQTLAPSANWFGPVLTLLLSSPMTPHVISVAVRFGAALAGDCAIGTIMAARTVDTTKRVTNERPGREPERREAIAAVSRINTRSSRERTSPPHHRLVGGHSCVPVPGYLSLPNNGHRGRTGVVLATVLRRPPDPTETS